MVALIWDYKWKLRPSMCSFPAIFRRYGIDVGRRASVTANLEAFSTPKSNPTIHWTPISFAQESGVCFSPLEFSHPLSKERVPASSVEMVTLSDHITIPNPHNSTLMLTGSSTGAGCFVSSCTEKTMIHPGHCRMKRGGQLESSFSQQPLVRGVWFSSALGLLFTSQEMTLTPFVTTRAVLLLLSIIFPVACVAFPGWA